MKNILMTFGLTAVALSTSCKDNFQAEQQIFEQRYKQSLPPLADYDLADDPCIVEVPFTEGEMKHLMVERLGVSDPKKYYDFCDSTVTITARGSLQSGPVYQARPMTELLGRERIEKDSAAAIYQRRVLKK